MIKRVYIEVYIYICACYNCPGSGALIFNMNIMHQPTVLHRPFWAWIQIPDRCIIYMNYHDIDDGGNIESHK